MKSRGELMQEWHDTHMALNECRKRRNECLRALSVSETGLAHMRARLHALLDACVTFSSEHTSVNVDQRLDPDIVCDPAEWAAFDSAVEKARLP